MHDPGSVMQSIYWSDNFFSVGQSLNQTRGPLSMQRFLLKDMLFSNDCPCEANCASLAGTGDQLHMMCVANQGTEDSVARVILR
jgi:hypothetical protein